MSIRDKVNFGHQSDCNLGVDADPCQKVARRGALTSHAAASAAGNVPPWGTAAALCHKYFITSITKHLTFMNLIRKMPSSPLLHFDAAGQEQEQDEDEEYREQVAAAARLSRVPNNQHSTGRAIAFFVATLFPRTSVSR